MLAGVFVEIFSKLKDPRVERTKKHLFLDVIGLALFAVLAGAQCYTEIEDFCRHHEDWLKNYFELPNGIPCHDTFSRLFSAIPTQSFQESFLTWLKAIIQLFPENIIPIDGKSIRASKRLKSGLKALHVVSAWSCANGISLGQIRVDDKTNEITAIPDILKNLCLQGAIVTLDAMGCQKQIAAQIIEQKGDYILRVKANQGGLLEEMEDLFQQSQIIQYRSMTVYSTQDEMNNDHGRIESRQCITLPEWKTFRAKLRGHVQYYGVSFNSKSVSIFLLSAERIMFKWLNRRSQRKSFDWDKFKLYTARNPLPQVKIYCRLF